MPRQINFFSRRFSTLQILRFSQIFLPHNVTLETDRSGRGPLRILLHLLLPALEKTYARKQMFRTTFSPGCTGTGRQATTIKKKIPNPNPSCHSSHQPIPLSLFTQLFGDTLLPSSCHPLFFLFPQPVPVWCSPTPEQWRVHPQSPVSFLPLDPFLPRSMGQLVTRFPLHRLSVLSFLSLGHFPHCLFLMLFLTATWNNSLMTLKYVS